MTLPVWIIDRDAAARAHLARVAAAAFGPATSLEAFTATPTDDDWAAMAHIPQGLVVCEAAADATTWRHAQRPGVHGRDWLWVATALFADDERLLPAIRAGAAGFLLKEQRLEVQVETLQAIARGRPPISPGLARTAGSLLFQVPSQDDRRARLQPVANLLGRGFVAREAAQQLGLSRQAFEDRVRSLYGLLHRNPESA